MSTVRKHSGDQAEFTFYNPAGTQWPATTKNVKSALDLIGPWARTDVGIPVASYTVAGIAAIATLAEIDEGTNDNKIVTPAGLAHRMTKPEATEDRFGMTRYATDSESMNESLNTRGATPKSIHYVFNNRLATEAKSGTAKVATTLMATTGADDKTIMTPLKTKQAIQALVPDEATASESVKGITKLATVQEARSGVAREGIAVSPYAFANANATESQAGTVKLATQAQMTQDTDLPVTSRRFRATRASTTQIGTTQLTTSFGNGSLALAANAPVVNKAGDNMTGRLKLNGDDYIVRSELTNNTVPIGFICMSAAGNIGFAGQWRECNGQMLNKNIHSVLFSRIGYTYGGSGDNFALPDMRDRFPRGSSGSRPVGRREEDAMQRITGSFMTLGRDEVNNLISGAFTQPSYRWNTNIRYRHDSSYGGRKIEFDSGRQTRIADETRPKNTALMFVIRVA